MRIGVRIARERDPLRTLTRDKKPLHTSRGEVEVRKPKRRSDKKTEHNRDHHSRAKTRVPRSEADRAERFADRDDHDQVVTLSEVRRLDAPAAQTHEHRADEA